MASPRHPRFERTHSIQPIKLTARDETIIQYVHRHRFLRSSDIAELVGGSTQQILRRLQLLFHHGYLTRPRAQIEYFGKGGSNQIVYGLGNKGAKLLKEKHAAPMPQLRWNEKNQSIRRFFLNHALAVADVMVAMELAARRNPGVRFIPADELFPPDTNKPHPFIWRIKAAKTTLGVIPDAVFALDRTRADGEHNRAYFFLEADRGTMPVRRKNLSQTSMHRKFWSYEATWRKALHKTLFGFHRFRVLVVTTSLARKAALIESCSVFKGGHGLFLFCDTATLKKNQNIFESPWVNGRGDPSTILP